MAMALLCLTLIVLVACVARSFFATQRAGTNLPPATVPAGGTEKPSATLVIDTVPFDRRRVERDPRARDMLFWDFKYVIPADHLAQVVFVLWSNGVPTIKPDLSGYFKVGPRPVYLESMDFSYEPNVSGPDGGTNVANWTVGLGFGYTLGHLVTNQPPCRKLETARRYVLHSGRQLAIRLADFIQPTGLASNAWSGVEVRLILRPLLSAPVQSDPNEFDRTNYVAGWGLVGMSEDSIMNLIKTLPCEPKTAEKSP